MLLHHPDAVFRREIGEETAILGVVQTIFEQFGGRATDGLAAAPVDVHEPAAGHAAEPAGRFDEHHPAALPSGRHGGQNAAGSASVDADVGGWFRGSLTAPRGGHGGSHCPASGLQEVASSELHGYQDPFRQRKRVSLR